MTLTAQTISSALENRRQIAEELGRVEAGQEPRTRFVPEEMRLMLWALDRAIAGYRKGLH